MNIRAQTIPDAGPSLLPVCKIGICGLGTVASGLIELITRDAARLTARAGRRVAITRIASRTPKPELMPESATYSQDILALVDDPEVDLVVELIGGVEPARGLIERALELGKPVVTANKEVLARHGDALFSLAREKSAPLGFEASVGGGIPIIKAMQESLAGDDIQQIVGIVNGTTNFILSRMDEQGASFEAALAEAKALGYAEAVPDYDIQGTDAAHKMAILAALAWGIAFNVDSVRTEGIEDIDLQDLVFAKRLGYAIRHLGVSHRADGAIESLVFPALVPQSNFLASVRGVTNAVEVTSRALGKSLYIGPGAGALPTANSVLSDILDIADGRGASGPPSQAQAMRARAQAEVPCAYYLRARVMDKTGVLARLTEVLASKGIGIDALLQPEIGDAGNDEACIALVTHVTSETSMREALAGIQAMREVRGQVSLIRIHDGD